MWVILSDGRKYEGDMLIGADGIWSKVSPGKIPCHAGLVTHKTMKMLNQRRSSPQLPSSEMRHSQV